MNKPINSIRRLYRQSLAGPGWKSLLTISLTLGYLFSPIDILPEIIPILGFTDDVALFLYFLRELFIVFVLGKKDLDNPKSKTSTNQKDGGRVIDVNAETK
jgi:uncharacterized membrane protein YkvA (DUF1232 family)